MPQPILTLQNQQLIKPISKNNTDMYNLMAFEVEQSALIDLLGNAFYTDLLANPTSEYNLKLISGCTFEKNGQTLKHFGLNYVLAYLNYSKYVSISDVSDTYTGMVQKKREETESLSAGRVKILQEDSRKIAFLYFDMIREWLNIEYKNFPYWQSANEKKLFTPKFIGITKTSYGRS